MKTIVICILIPASILLLRLFPKTKWVVAAVYLAGVLYCTFMTREPFRTQQIFTQPLRELKNALEYEDRLITAILSGKVRIKSLGSLERVFQNILLFIPFGYLLPTLWPKTSRYWAVVPLGFLFSLAIETVQLYTRLGIFDVDDLINNTLGSLIGWLCYLLFLRKKAEG